MENMEIIYVLGKEKEILEKLLKIKINKSKSRDAKRHG
jgi:hypothetical protein